jgi:hypothetical protein
MFKRRLHDKAATACSPPQSADRARVLALTCSQLVLSPPLARHTLRDLLIVCNFAKSSARHSRRRQQRMHATVQSRPVGPSGRQCASRRRTPHTGGLPAAPQALDWGLLPRALLGVLALLCGNGFIVGINQVYDVDIDAVNKPFLPVAAGAALLCPLNSRAVRLGYGWVVRPPCSAARCRTAAYTNRVSMPGGAMLGCQYNGSDALRDTFMRMAVSMASRCTGRQRGKQPLPLSSLSKHMSRACPPPPPLWVGTAPAWRRARQGGRRRRAGELSPAAASALCLALAAGGLALTAANFGRAITGLYTFGLFLGTVYSVPPLRLKRFAIPAFMIIATVRPWRLPS